MTSKSGVFLLSYFFTYRKMECKELSSLFASSSGLTPIHRGVEGVSTHERTVLGNSEEGSCGFLNFSLFKITVPEISSVSKTA